MPAPCICHRVRYTPLGSFLKFYRFAPDARSAVQLLRSWPTRRNLRSCFTNLRQTCVYAVGGYNPALYTLSSVEMYNPASRVGPRRLPSQPHDQVWPSRPVPVSASVKTPASMPSVALERPDPQLR